MSFTAQKLNDKIYAVQFKHNEQVVELEVPNVNNEVELKGIVDAHIAYLDRGENLQQYADKRRREYPPVEEYMDGLVKGDQAQMQAYIDKCMAVKTKYPKD